MAYIFENPNPRKRKVGDCVIRALSIGLDQPWDDIYYQLSGYGYDAKDMMSSNAVWDEMLRDYGFSRRVVQDRCKNGCYTIHDFCRDNRTGLYVLGTGSHVVTVKNGDYFDTWDSGDEVPMYFYERG